MSNTYNLCPDVRRQYVDIDGNPMSGGKLFYYQAGTTTKVNTYKDVAGDTLNANPIILDSNGRTPFAVFLSPAIQYKEVLAYSTDTDPPTSPVYTEDNISGRGVYGVVTIESYGAVGDGVANDSPAFDAAIAALDANGGKIIVPLGSYKLDTVIEQGEKSIYWDIAPGTTWSGAGYTIFKFPCMVSNGAQVAAGPYMRGTNNFAAPPEVTGNNGGTSVFCAEYIQSQSIPQVSNACAGYFGAEGTEEDGLVWSLNTLINCMDGAGGLYQGIEVDVNNYSTVGGETAGVTIFTGGITDSNVGVQIGKSASDPVKWIYGVLMDAVESGIIINNSDGDLARGIAINDTLGHDNSLFGGTLLVNSGGDGIILNRNTDTLPSGYFLRFVNRANDTNLFLVDTKGKLTIGNPASNTAFLHGTQQENNEDCIVLKRFTDSTPTGFFLRAVNAANNDQIFAIDVEGNISTDGGTILAGSIDCGVVNAANLRADTGAVAVSSGTVCFGNGTATTVGAAGGASSLPAAPLGYMIAYVGSTQVKIPYYSA